MEFGIQNILVADSPLLTNQVFERLMASIALGELKPGQRIRQNELANKLNVSRQPVSQALQLLKHEGLVRDSGRQGLEVTPIDPEYMKQMYQARKALEVTAVGLAAQRVADRVVTAEEVAALTNALTHGQQTYQSDGPLPMLIRADLQFHQAIYRLSGNCVIEQMMNARWAHLMRSMLIILDEPETPGRAWEEHEEMTEYVLSGNVLEGTDLAARHMQRASSDMYRRLTEVIVGAD
ncbi:GntR family transcriptional regulator [Burkholderia cenocepacia]|uniref:GntR family transcriptional regulator n=1 Tax=Burkholderia cenocepacia TaxID=95486 RepID=UPI0028575B87|nr:GntR family transcriptional regulator [Burkholderia cenocepacia]MDR8071864.1 GntR family transcriptional regulator [Burkholderia cenocepacia]